MVPYYGDFAEDSTVYIPINTFDSNDPAASVTVTNLANTDVHIHKDGGTTQRNNAAGITMTIDYDSITGNHLLIIDTSDNTVTNFWQAGHEYQVRVEGITVDAGTINAWVGAFSIERAGGALALIKSATYGLSALKTLLDTTGIKVASFADNAITAASINADAITNAKIADNAIAVENIADNAITAAKIANGAIDAATFAADVDAEIATMVWNAATASYGGAGTYGQAVEDVRDDTNELQTDWHDGGRLDLLLDGASAPSAATVADAVWDEALAGHSGAGSAGVALTAAGSAGDPWSTLIPGSYGAGTAGLLLGTTIPNAIDAIDNYVDTEVGALTTELAKVPKSDSNVSWNATALAAIQSECTDALNAYDPPTKAEVDTACGAVTLANGAHGGAATVITLQTPIVANTTQIEGGDATNALTAAVPTAAAIADAVWDEASTGHTDAGKAGAQVWTDIDAILEDTGTTLDTLVKDIPTTAEFEARTIAAADYVVVADLGTVQTGDSYAIVNGDHGLVSIQDDVDAIKAKTDSLTFTKANEVDANIQSINGTAVNGDGGATPWGP